MKFDKQTAALVMHAFNIPDLGKGGLCVWQELIIAMENCPKNTSIIDIAPYIGSTTAFLCLGKLCNDRNDLKIISIDRWKETKAYRKKAKIHHEMEIKEGDLQTLWTNNIFHFNCDVTSIKTDIIKYIHDGSKIGLVIDDICNDKLKMDKMIKHLSPYFIPGETVLFLMDHEFYKTKNSTHLRYQYDFMKLNKKAFELLKIISGSMCAVYRYLGGRIHYLKGDEYYDRVYINK